MQSIKSFFTKFKSFFLNIGKWISEKYANNRKKCKGTILTLAILTLLTGLIVGSYKSVDSLSLGAPINYTSGTILDITNTNIGSFMGLNTYYKTIPNTNFLISFEKTKENIERSFPPIKARVIQGALFEVQVYAKVKISLNNLKSFFQNYGFDEIEGSDAWLIYIKEKIKNVVSQQVASFRFYQISNKALSEAINKIFTGYETTTSLSFPFVVRIISINLHYPQQSIKSNNTLGVKLLEHQSLLSQLTTQLSQVETYISTYNGSTVNYALKRGQIQGQMASRQNAVKLASSLWSEGVQTFSKAVNQNQTLLQKYLQVYFNSLYNITYRVKSLQPFQI